jgi:hypothetical protein
LTFLASLADIKFNRACRLYSCSISTFFIVIIDVHSPWPNIREIQVPIIPSEVPSAAPADEGTQARNLLVGSAPKQVSRLRRIARERTILPRSK